MLKLTASFSKKVPIDGQRFSSQSYHASVEAELPDGLTQEQLTSRIHDTFTLVRDSVESELHNGNGAESAPFSSVSSTPQSTPAETTRGGAMASAKQIKFLTDLAIRRKMDLAALNAEAQRLFGVIGTGQLTRKQASQFIDMLNGKDEGERKAA